MTITLKLNQKTPALPIRLLIAVGMVVLILTKDVMMVGILFANSPSIAKLVTIWLPFLLLLLELLIFFYLKEKQKEKGRHWKFVVRQTPTLLIGMSFLLKLYFETSFFEVGLSIGVVIKYLFFLVVVLVGHEIFLTSLAKILEVELQKVARPLDSNSLWIFSCEKVPRIKNMVDKGGWLLSVTSHYIATWYLGACMGELNSILYFAPSSRFTTQVLL